MLYDSTHSCYLNCNDYCQKFIIIITMIINILIIIIIAIMFIVITIDHSFLTIVISIKLTNIIIIIITVICSIILTYIWMKIGLVNMYYACISDAPRNRLVKYPLLFSTIEKLVSSQVSFSVSLGILTRWYWNKTEHKIALLLANVIAKPLSSLLSIEAES